MFISVEEAASLICHGQIIAIPTETVYGLAGSILFESGIKQIFSLKNRPLTNPLILHISHLKQVEEFVQMPKEDELKLIESFWPGPLTVLLRLKHSSALPKMITAGLPTVAIRMPNQKQTLHLIEKTGPLVAPSANKSGLPSSTKKEHIAKDFGENFPVLEGSCGKEGIESTIVISINGKIKIAREGSLLASDMEKVLGYLPEILVKQNKPICPGQHFRHYAPNAKIQLVSYDEIRELNEVVIGFEDREYKKAKQVLHLGKLNDPKTQQNNLYAILRELDQQGISQAYIDQDFMLDERSQIIKKRLEKAAQ